MKLLLLLIFLSLCYIGIVFTFVLGALEMDIATQERLREVEYTMTKWKKEMLQLKIKVNTNLETFAETRDWVENKQYEIKKEKAKKKRKRRKYGRN